MASVFKPKGSDKYHVMWTSEDGRRRKKVAYTDRRESERLAAKLQERVHKIRDGLIDPREEKYRDHLARPLVEHLGDWIKDLEARGNSEVHVEQFTARVRRAVAVVMGAKPSEIDPPPTAKRAEVPKFAAALTRWTAKARLFDLDVERAQDALATIKAEGRSSATCNHYKTALVSFSLWLYNTRRLRENPLRGLKGFKARADIRHDRRTISLADLQHLVAVTETGGTFRGMSGPARALCYRLAVATGLRYSEIMSVTPSSFDWEAATVTVQACYTKNRDLATLPLTDELARDLRAWVDGMEPERPIFPMPKGKGAELLKIDLEAAGIAYQDESGRFFDFHSLRCECATLADAANASPQVVQKLMRHKTAALTAHYSRPTPASIAATAAKIPSLVAKPPAALAATGTGDPVPFGATVQPGATSGSGDACNVLSINGLR